MQGLKPLKVVSVFVFSFFFSNGTVKIDEAQKARAPRLTQKPRKAPKSPRLKNGLRLTLFKAQQCAPRAFVRLGARFFKHRCCIQVLEKLASVFIIIPNT